MIYTISNLGILNEARTAFQGSFEGYKICIEIDGSSTETNFRYDPYFKIYDSDKISTSKHVARVFIDAKPDIYYNLRYTHHKNGRIKRPLWELNDNDKRMINDVCREVIIGHDGHKRTVWGEILHAVEYITNQPRVYYPQPDYTKLVYMPTDSGRSNQKDPNKRI